MLGGAFAAAAAAQVTGSAWLGLVAGIAVRLRARSRVHGFASITQRGDQVVSGMALNVIAAGLGPTLADAWFRPGRPRAGDRGGRPLRADRPALRRGRARASRSWGRSMPR